MRLAWRRGWGGFPSTEHAWKRLQIKMRCCLRRLLLCEALAQKTQLKIGTWFERHGIMNCPNRTCLQHDLSVQYAAMHAREKKHVMSMLHGLLRASLLYINLSKKHRTSDVVKRYEKWSAFKRSWCRRLKNYFVIFKRAKMLRFAVTEMSPAFMVICYTVYGE